MLCRNVHVYYFSLISGFLKTTKWFKAYIRFDVLSIVCSITPLYIPYRDCRRMHILNCRSSIYTLLHSRVVKNFMRADKLSTEPLWISEPVRYSDSFSRLWARAFSLTHLGVCWKWNIFHAVLVHYASSLYGKPSWCSCYLHRMRWAFWSSVWFREECDGFKSVSFSASSWRESLGCRSDHCAPPSYIQRHANLIDLAFINDPPGWLSPAIMCTIRSAAAVAADELCCEFGFATKKLFINTRKMIAVSDTRSIIPALASRYARQNMQFN